MSRDKVYFAVGLIIGVAFTILFLSYFAPRYTMAKTGDTLIKQDTWTGQSWRLVENEWKTIHGINRDWDKIDQALRSALRIPFVDVNVDSAMQTLKEKYPILGDLSNEELSERIKIVYSKYVLINLYLDSFVKMKDGPKDTKEK